MKRTSTSTSDFGVSRREGHDASRFYGSKLYEGLRVNERAPVIDASATLDVARLDCPMPFTEASLEKVPGHSIHLAIVAVPPFSGDSTEGIDAWLDTVRSIIASVIPKLATGGRLVLLVDDEVDPRVAPSGYWPFHAYIATRALELGVYMRGEVILTRPPPGGAAIYETGGLRPAIRQAFIHGLVFSKVVPRRAKRAKGDALERTDTITRDEFLECTKSVWHPRDGEGFPARVARFASLYSFLEDTVLLVRGDGQASIQEALVAARPRCVVLALQGGGG